MTLKLKAGLPSLRSSRRFAAVRACFAGARGKHGLRIVEFAVLGEHLHLVVEADSSQSLSRGMQGLCVRLVRALNSLLRRTGGLFADHYHSHVLRTPTEVARALRYVLDNAEHHFGEGASRGAETRFVNDWCTSTAPELRELLLRPLGWLLSVGWKRAASPMPREYAPGAPYESETSWRAVVVCSRQGLSETRPRSVRHHQPPGKAPPRAWVASAKLAAVSRPV